MGEFWKYFLPLLASTKIFEGGFEEANIQNFAVLPLSDLKVVSVLFWHVLADIITYIHGTPGITSLRWLKNPPLWLYITYR